MKGLLAWLLQLAKTLLSLFGQRPVEPEWYGETGLHRHG